MKILGIDTSAVTCAVALIENDKVLAEFSRTDAMTHSEVLLPAIRSVLDGEGLELSDLDAIAVSAGPGSFTGLRIGLSTVKGLAVSTGLMCASVSTLEALAMNASQMNNVTVCALMDARRGEFYHAMFRIEANRPIRLIPDCAAKAEIIAETLKKEASCVIVGDGALKFTQMYPEYASFLAPESIRLQNGASVAKLGLQKAMEGEFISPEQLSPIYHRLPQAEREWNEKHKNDCEVKK